GCAAPGGRPPPGGGPPPGARAPPPPGAGSALTLVSAPAGFGKTTLLTEWLAADGRRAAWLSLDRRDNDPTTFWTYLITALRTAVPQVGGAALSLLASPRSPIEDVLATVVNDLSAAPDEVVLVLDDYHVIDAREVHDGMEFLLEHLPPQVHLVIAGRADPALPLARMRARGELVEVRAADLRFTPDETAAYLTGAMGLALTARDVAALEGRTEGWIAALQLAALSMQGRDDLAGFVAGYPGQSASGPVRERTRRAITRRGRPAPGPSPARSGGRRQDGKPHRDQCAAGARARDARRHPRGAGATGTRPDAGRAGRLRPDPGRRGPTHGGPTGSGRETPDRAEPCPATADRLPKDAGPDDREPGLDRPLERT
ncbi:MAG: hypothetical protein L0H64_18280, partial [Pseudonocardia sp.]|nr:hypothetical protein [Pseudonocardia sp.]